MSDASCKPCTYGHSWSGAPGHGHLCLMAAVSRGLAPSRCLGSGRGTSDRHGLDCSEKALCKCGQPGWVRFPGWGLLRKKSQKRGSSRPRGGWGAKPGEASAPPSPQQVWRASWWGRSFPGGGALWAPIHTDELNRMCSRASAGLMGGQAIMGQSLRGAVGGARKPLRGDGRGAIGHTSGVGSDPRRDSMWPVGHVSSRKAS